LGDLREISWGFVSLKKIRDFILKLLDFFSKIKEFLDKIKEFFHKLPDFFYLYFFFFYFSLRKFWGNCFKGLIYSDFRKIEFDSRKLE